MLPAGLPSAVHCCLPGAWPHRPITACLPASAPFIQSLLACQAAHLELLLHGIQVGLVSQECIIVVLGLGQSITAVALCGWVGG